MRILRQGDVMLVAIANLPAACTEMPAGTDGKTILAWGEATGHHHRVETPTVRLWTANGERFLQVLMQSELLHEEHSPVGIPPGLYKLPSQMEYTPEVLRRIAD